MKHSKRFLGLLSAAALALNAIPVLPVPAVNAADPVPAAGLQDETDDRIPAGNFVKGGNWYQYGKLIYQYSCDFTLSNDIGYCGICGTLSAPDLKFYIIEGWNKWRPMHSTPADTVTIDGRQYDIYLKTSRTAVGDHLEECTEVWSVASTNAYQDGKNIKRNVTVSDHFKAWEKVGAGLGRLDELKICAEAFVQNEIIEESVKVRENKMLAEYADPSAKEKDPVHRSGMSYDNFDWSLDRVSGSGSAVIAPHTDNGFSCFWSDVTPESASLFRCGKKLAPMDLSKDKSGIIYSYYAEIQFQGDVNFGVSCTLKDPETEKVTEVFIVEGWCKTRPVGTELLGEAVLGEEKYDVYAAENVGFAPSGNAPAQQIWFVRQKSECITQADVNVTAYLAALRALEFKTGELTGVAAYVSAVSGSGSVDFVQNQPVKEKNDGTEPVKKESDTEDGWHWSMVQYDTGDSAEMQYNDNGKFTAKFPNGSNAQLTCGMKLKEPIPSAELYDIRYAYSVDAALSGDAMFGIRGSFEDPQTEFVIVEGFSGALPDGLEKLEETYIDGREYNIYQQILGAMPENDALPDTYLTRYWSVCTEQPDLGEEYSSANTVDVPAHIMSWESCGLKAGSLREIGAFAESRGGEGSIVFRKNKCKIKAYSDWYGCGLTDYTENFFGLGKTLLLEDIYMPDYLLNNYAAAALDDSLRPIDCLQYEMPEDGSINVKFNSLAENYLTFCESEQIPVVIGSLISPNSLPKWFFTDENGKYLTAEAMDDRLAALVKDYFELLQTKYPALEIIGMNVSSDMYRISDLDRTAADWKAIYGDDRTGFLAKVYDNARKYAPKTCKLYMQELICESDSELKELCEFAKAVDAENGSLDGVSFAVDITEPENWMQFAKQFKADITAVDELGYDVILSDVMTVTHPVYHNSMRLKAMKAAFETFADCHDSIDMIYLHDQGRSWDGPVSLKELDLMSAVIPALYGYTPDTEQYIGDVSCDGATDVSDAVMLARFVAEDADIVLSEQGKLNGDMDGSNTLDAEDVLLILKKIARLTN